MKHAEVEIDFFAENDLNFYHVFKKATIKPNTTYRLSGYLKADTLNDNEGVCLEIQDARGWTKTRSASATGRVWGTTDWIYVETDYASLPDAEEAKMNIRRISGKGSVKGRVFVKDVELTEVPSRLEGKEALSVSASRSADGKTTYLMVLNKNVYDDVQAGIEMRNITVDKKIDVWTLNGPAVWATNEKDSNNVIIKKKSIEMTEADRLGYAFPAHSLTSLAFTSN